MAEQKVIEIGPAGSVLLTAREIKKKRLPPIDDDFAKEYGDCDNLEELKKKIREDLQREGEAKESERLQEELITQLIENNPFEVPEKAVERQLDFLTGRDETRSTPLESSRSQSETQALRQELRPQALRRIQRLWVLESVANQEGIEVDEKECEQEIERFSERAQTALPELRRFFAQERRKAELEARIREKKTLDLLMGLAQVEEDRADQGHSG